MGVMSFGWVAFWTVVVAFWGRGFLLGCGFWVWAVVVGVMVLVVLMEEEEVQEDE